eukprot:3365317-Rhodomonas_salina.1
MAVCVRAVCRAALDNFVKIAEFLMDIAGRDFLAAAHVVLQHGRKLSHEALNRQVERATSVERASSMAVLDKEKKLVKGQVEVSSSWTACHGGPACVTRQWLCSQATQDDTVRIASVKMLTVLNDLYGRKRFKPHDVGPQLCSRLFLFGVSVAVLDLQHSALSWERAGPYSVLEPGWTSMRSRSRRRR